MARAVVAKPKKGAKAARRSKTQSYHHGDLRQALITGVLQLVKKKGAAAVSMREAARLAGVSSGAPFRHFANRDELLQAVAEQANEDLRVRMETVRGDDPVANIRNYLLTYLRWAFENPELCELISSAQFAPFRQRSSLGGDAEARIARYESYFVEAFEQGELAVSRDELRAAVVGLRALIYGFARMKGDGHFPRFGVPPNQQLPMIETALRIFMRSIVRADRSGDLERQSDEARDVQAPAQRSA